VKRPLKEGVSKIIDKQTNRSVEEELCKKIEETLNRDEVKSEIPTRIEEG
jgi:hypothetical protein